MCRLGCRAHDAPIKLIDFSLAVFFRQPAEPCGTPEFMAPELIANPDEVAKTGTRHLCHCMLVSTNACGTIALTATKLVLLANDTLVMARLAGMACPAHPANLSCHQLLCAFEGLQADVASLFGCRLGRGGGHVGSWHPAILDAQRADALSGAFH